MCTNLKGEQKQFSCVPIQISCFLDIKKGGAGHQELKCILQLFLTRFQLFIKSFL